MQGRWSLNHPFLDEIEMYAELGVKVMIISDSWCVHHQSDSNQSYSF